MDALEIATREGVAQRGVPISVRPPYWSVGNPYVCRLLVRIDAIIWRLRGRSVCWLSGVLAERVPAGHGVELRSHFPSWMFRGAAYLQSRWPWTRRILSL